MEVKTIAVNGIGIAIVQSDKVLISDLQSALDFMMTVQYETGHNRIILNKSAICEDFSTVRRRSPMTASA